MRRRRNLRRFRVVMQVGSGRVIDKHAVASSAYAAAEQTARIYLGGAEPYRPGRKEQPDAEGRSVYSFAIPGYGLRMWIREQ